MQINGKLIEMQESLGDRLYTYSVSIGGHAVLHVGVYVTEKMDITYIKGMDPLAGYAREAFMTSFCEALLAGKLDTVKASVR